MRKVVVFIVIALIAALVVPVTAQEPGESGPIIEAFTGSSANMNSFNPLRCNTADCAKVYAFMFPTLVGVDVETGNFANSIEAGDASLAVSWDISEDGTEYTFHLRDDAFWSDGTPITANDIKFSYDAIASGEIGSDLSGYVDAGVTAVEVIDDYTVKFTYAEASCDALSLAAATYPTPAHRFDNDYMNMVDSDYDLNPDVTAGVFQFGRVGDGQVVLVRNEDAYGVETVRPEGYIFVDSPDTTVAVERMLAGEINFLESPERQRRQELIDSPEVNTYAFPANGWNYIGLNLADPENPQPGYDEEGNFIDQGHHPIFGDVNVRRALQLGMNVQEFIEIVSLNQGIQMASFELPTSWAVNPDLAPIPYDPEAAGAMLDEAGWVMGDDDVRVCQGCMYAEEGTPMSFTLMTSEGSPNAERIVLLFQAQMKEIGVEVEPLIIDFNTMIADMTGQTFDATLLAWSNSYPVNPDITQIFSGEADVLGSGFNFVSYHNPEALALNEQARILPGCDADERAALYHQVQEMVQADQPYLWLYTTEDMYAARTEIHGFAPYDNAAFWNVDTWEIDRID